MKRVMRTSIRTMAYRWQQEIFVGISPTTEETNWRWYEYFRRDMLETRRLRPQRSRYPSDGRRR
jgi:hypothetical protein